VTHSHELKGVTINKRRSMFYKDFKLLRKVNEGTTNALRQIRKQFTERNSRPRAKENVINPNQKGI
jgi:hypothetical protein